MARVKKPKTLADLKKGDPVVVKLFTGVPISKKVVYQVADTFIVTEMDGLPGVVYDRETGKQIDPVPDNVKHACYITVDDGSYEARRAKKPKKTNRPYKSPRVQFEEIDESEYKDAEFV